MKGLFGIWLQAMVLTAIGVFAGTFLSWPVALLFTIAFFVAGHAAFSVLKEFFLQTIVGGGPFESLIRLLVARQPDERAGADPGRGRGQDARLDRHAGDVPDGLPDPQPVDARRQQHRGRRVRRQLAP